MFARCVCTGNGGVFEECVFALIMCGYGVCVCVCVYVCMPPERVIISQLEGRNVVFLSEIIPLCGRY